MNRSYFLTFICIALFCTLQAQNTCSVHSTSAKLDVNNVNTVINNIGDMWWDNISAKYEIPKGSGVNALFSGGVWIGGLDNGGQLHVAAMTYRQNGIDYWPGPLDTINGKTTDTLCVKYNSIFTLTPQMVDSFKINYANVNYTIPPAILDWPANGNTAIGFAKKLAPYVDVNGDGKYNAHDGDYPAYDPSASIKNNYLFGDQTLYWMFNDAGNIHGETGGLPLGVEVHGQAFAYKSSDDLNNTTFYKYKLINRSSNNYHDVYIGLWVDCDLGDFTDDYVGCDVKRDLGYCYNGDLIDGAGTIGTYGANPPAIGVRLLSGPKADANDGIDNNHNGTIDEPGETIGMSGFVYYNNDFGMQGNPTKAQDYYNYLKGIWLDGTPFTYGGDAYQESGPVCKYMFPGDSDPTGFGTGGVPQANWSEASVSNLPGDRRFLMTMGPFSFNAGQEQDVSFAVVWARSDSSVNALKDASDAIQNYYDSSFKNICKYPAVSFAHSINKLDVNFSCPLTASSYSWDFGDGSTSVLQNPLHTYPSVGKFKVKLTVATPCGTDTASGFLNLHAYTKPVGVELTRIEGQGNGGQTLDFIPSMYDSVLTSGVNRILHPTYKALRGPVYVEVYDTTLLPKGTFAIQFLDTAKTNLNWKIFKYGNSGAAADTAYSTSTPIIGAYYMIAQWGLAVDAHYSKNPGTNYLYNNGFIESSMEFTDPTKDWLTGVPDNDTAQTGATGARNWIRSGLLPVSYAGSTPNYAGIDDNEAFEKTVNRNWAPYRLCGISDVAKNIYGGPAWPSFISSNKMSDVLRSVDVIITPDKSKWSRCPVLEMCDDPLLAENGGIKHDLRKHASVDKYGSVGDGVVTTDPNDADFISATGMGWFPGYAVNLETGERLNMAFGENSFMPAENGNDMLWNPTSTEWDILGNFPVFGGMHYIYIFNHTGDAKFAGSDAFLPNGLKDIPRYDAGSTVWKLLNAKVLQGSSSSVYKREVYYDAMWVNVPMLKTSKQFLSTDVKVRLRVARSYRKNYSTLPDTAFAQLNKNYPLYNFNSGKLISALIENNDQPVALTVFPNPTNDFVNFRFENLNERTYNLEIYDAFGRKVLERLNTKNTYLAIDGKELGSGIYFYRVTGVNIEDKAGKVIIR